MKKEDKELLLKDLCARLPYGVKIRYRNIIDNIQYIEPDFGEICLAFPNNDYTVDIEDVKPYLRPMSSMTEEESAELSNIISEWFDKELFYLTEEPFLEYALSKINYSVNPLLFDWLNANHFDYRGLIPKGLAIEVTEENNPYKD